MITCGIDFSTHEVVIAMANGGRCLWLRSRMEGRDADDRLRDLYRSFPSRNWWLDRNLDGVAIERPAGKVAHSMYRVMGAIIAAIPPPLLVVQFSPPEWRKIVGLGGGCSKEEILQEAVKRLFNPHHLLNGDNVQDKADAYMIATALKYRLLRESEAA